MLGPGRGARNQRRRCLLLLLLVLTACTEGGSQHKGFELPPPSARSTQVAYKLLFTTAFPGVIGSA